ncbi:MAG: hypothetical protein DWQ01_09845 [Planctomycetota bacterium]|nr:MAG: hypothetical protein DWQ01_09845 [Planctomycetota bacterium]
MATIREPKWKLWLRQLESVETNPFTVADAASVLLRPSTPPAVILCNLCARGFLHRVEPGRYFRHVEPSGRGSLFTKDLTLNACEDDDLTLFTDGVIAGVTRLGLEPESTERYEFLNNHILWNQWRLQSGDPDLLRWRPTRPTVSRFVLFQSIDEDSARIVRDSIDVTYEEKAADEDVRAAVDAMLQLWVCGLYAKDGFVPILNETTGQPMYPDFIASEGPDLKLIHSTPT